MRGREMPRLNYPLGLGNVLTLANIVGHSQNSRENRRSQRLFRDFECFSMDCFGSAGSILRFAPSSLTRSGREARWL